MINLAISIEDIIKKIDNIVWGIPLIALIIIVGIVLTILLKGIQFRKLGLAFKFLTEKEDGEGEVSTFQALCISLSATIGTGNITGVATAVAIGGAPHASAYCSALMPDALLPALHEALQPVPWTL